MNSRHELVAAKSPDPIIVTRALIKRAWSDFEPKVVSGLMSGTVSAALIEALSAYGIHTPGIITAGLPVACYFLASYLTPSVGTVTTVRTGDGLVVEKHSGSVEIKTGAIPLPNYVPRETYQEANARPVKSMADTFGTTVPREIPAPRPTPPPTPEPEPAPYEVPDRASQSHDDSPGFTQVLQPAEPEPAIPPAPATPPAWMTTSRTPAGSAFLAHLPSSGGNPVAYHDNPEDGH